MAKKFSVTYLTTRFPLRGYDPMVSLVTESERGRRKNTLRS